MADDRHIDADLADADIYFAVADPYRMIYADIRVKCYMDRRDGAFRVVPAKCFFVESCYLIDQWLLYVL